MPIKDEVLVARPIPVTLPDWEDSEPVDVPEWDDSEEVPTIKVEPWQEPGQEYGPFGPTTQAGKEEELKNTLMGVVSLPGALLDAAGKGLVKVADLPTELMNRQPGRLEGQPGHITPLSESLSPQIPKIPELQVESRDPLMRGIGAGVNITTGGINTLTGLANQMLPPFAPPEVGFMLPLTMGGGLPAKIASGLFGASMAVTIPEQIRESAKVLEDPNASLQQKTEAALTPGINTVFAKRMLSHAVAGRPVTGAELKPREGGTPEWQAIQNDLNKAEASLLDFERKLGPRFELDQMGQQVLDEKGEPIPVRIIPEREAQLLKHRRALLPEFYRLIAEKMDAEQAMAKPIPGTTPGATERTPDDTQDKERVPGSQPQGPEPGNIPNIGGSQAPTPTGGILQAPTAPLKPSEIIPEIRTELSPKTEAKPFSGGTNAGRKGEKLNDWEKRLGWDTTNYEVQYFGWSKDNNSQSVRARLKGGDSWLVFDLPVGADFNRVFKDAQLKGEEAGKSILEGMARRLPDDILQAKVDASTDPIAKAIWQAEIDKRKQQTPPAVTSAPVSSVPAPTTETVRVYHGEEAGSGADGSWFARDPARARTFGKNVSYVDLPKDVFEQLQKQGKEKGLPEGDIVLPDEWVKKGQPIEIEQKVHELEPAPDYTKMTPAELEGGLKEAQASRDAATIKLIRDELVKRHTTKPAAPPAEPKPPKVEPAKAPTEPTPKELEPWLTVPDVDATEAAKIAAKKAGAIAEMEAKQKAADEAEAAKLLGEAQAVVDSAPRTRKAVEIKEELIDRIEQQMDKTIEAAKVTLTKNAGKLEGADYYNAQAGAGGKLVRGTIFENANGRFEVSAGTFGGNFTLKSVIVATRAEAERILKVMAADVSGKAVIAVPGDGIFTIHRNGENLVSLWGHVRAIVTGAAPTAPKAPISGRAKAAPKLQKLPDIKAALKIMRQQVVDRKSGPAPLADVYSDGQHVYATDGRILVVLDTVQPKGGPEGFPIEGVKAVWPHEMSDKPASVPTEDLWRISRLARNLEWKDGIPRVQLFVDDKGNIAGESMDVEGNAAGWGDPRGKRSLGFFDAEYIGTIAEIARSLGHAVVTLQTGVKGEGAEMSYPLVMKAKGIRALVGNVRDIEREKPKAAVATIPSDRAGLEEFLKKAREDLQVYEQQIKRVLKGPDEQKVAREEGPIEARDQAKIDIARAEAKLANLPKTEPGAPAPEGPGGAKAYMAEERIPRKPIDIFNATDADLADLHKERFGEMGGESGTAYSGKAAKIKEFRSFEEFRAWMDARYAERNLEHMKRAYAEAEGAWKTRYIKETGKDPATDELKRAVIRHLATGADLPPEFIPVAPAAPPPGQGSPQGPAYEQPPPPPPREPTEYQRFDITALTQLYRFFSRFPTMNARMVKAFGRFLPDTGAVELKERLLWDTKLATRVLAHEVGHFVDLMLTPVGKGARDFARRFAPLHDFKKAVRDRADLNQAAKALSARWRGPFSPNDSYRNSGEELFADTMSALLANPEMVNREFPIIHDAFERMRADKPAFRNAYSLLTSWLRGDEIPDQILKQQAEANARTLKDLMKDDVIPTQTFTEKLKQATVSLWHRIYAIEGKPRALGDKIISKLERSHVWADAQNAIFYDDWLRRVLPNLQKVDPSMEKARALFHSFMIADRIIKERHAAGQWIETNPEPARAMLDELTKLPELQQYRQQLQAASDDALYDLAAQMMRTAHDRGPRFIRQVDRTIDRLALGVAGDAVVQAFNVRGKLLNPGGVTPQRAAQIISTIRSRLTPEQFDALRNGAKEFRAMVFDVSSKAHDEGLISDRTWDEIVAPNADNYIPFAVLDYWEGKVPSVVPQTGTARDVADVAMAAHLKVASINTWRQSQRQIKLIQQAYQNGGLPVLPGKALEHSRDIEDVRRQGRKDDVSRAVMWVQGRPRVMEFPNDPGKTIEEALSHQAFYHHLELLSTLNKLTHNFMSIFTTFSPSFMGYRNPIRDVLTSANRIGLRSTAFTSTHANDLAKWAWNYANAAFGGQMDPVIRDLVEKQVLMPPRLATSVVRDQTNLSELLQNGAVMAFHARRLQNENWKWYHGGEPGRKLTQTAEKVFAAYEAFAKIQAYFSAQTKGMSESEAQAVARIAGIPNPGVMGKWSTPMEVFFPWARVHIQGLRADLDVIKDPNINRGFAARVVLLDVLPRIAKVALAAGLANGVIKNLFPGKEDNDDLVLGEFFRRVSPYKMALDDILPLAFYDPRKGEYHFLWEFKNGKSVPVHYEAVSWRIPSSEQGRIWGTLTYQALSGLPMTKEALSRPGNDLVSNMGAWLRDYALVGANPLAETGQNIFQGSVMGKNPEDSFTGRPSFNRELFEAGGKERAGAVAGYTMQRFGDAGYLAALTAVNLGLLDERVLNTLQSKMDGDKQAIMKRIPLLKSASSYDNYARYRAEKNVELQQTEFRAKAKLIMSPEVHAMYQYYWRNQDRVKQMDPTERRRFEVAKSWVNSIWGDMKEPGSQYSKALHAVGPDGSSMAKETARRDLDTLSRGYVLRFQAGK